MVKRGFLTEEVRDAVRGLCKARCCCTRSDGLDFGGVELEADGPR